MWCSWPTHTAQCGCPGLFVYQQGCEHVCTCTDSPRQNLGNGWTHDRKVAEQPLPSVWLEGLSPMSPPCLLMYRTVLRCRAAQCTCCAALCCIVLHCTVPYCVMLLVPSTTYLCVCVCVCRWWVEQRRHIVLHSNALSVILCIVMYCKEPTCVCLLRVR